MAGAVGTATGLATLKEDLANAKASVVELTAKVEALEADKVNHDTAQLRSQEELQSVKAELEGLRAVKVGLVARVQELQAQADALQQSATDEQEGEGKREELEMRIRELEGQVKQEKENVTKGEELLDKCYQEFHEVNREYKKAKKDMEEAAQREEGLKEELGMAQVCRPLQLRHCSTFLPLERGKVTLLLVRDGHDGREAQAWLYFKRG